jgi:hypothetical protein
MHGAVDSKTDALILTADRDGLRAFIDWLQDPGRSTMLLDELTSDRQTTRPIRSLSIEFTADGVVIDVYNDVARFTGSREAFAHLIYDIEQFAKDEDLYEPGSHTHFDPSDGSSVRYPLARGSAPLIIAGPVPDEPVLPS